MWDPHAGKLYIASTCMGTSPELHVLTLEELLDIMFKRGKTILNIMYMPGYYAPALVQFLHTMHPHRRSPEYYVSKWEQFLYIKYLPGTQSLI